MNVILNTFIRLWNILGGRESSAFNPDKHIIEVGENMKVVCRRFLDSGMTPDRPEKISSSDSGFVMSPL